MFDDNHLKETPADAAVRDGAYRVAESELRSIVEKIERCEADKQSICDDIKEFYSEAKGRGYSTKVLRKVIAMRKRDRDDLAEEDAILALYRNALGV